MSDLSLSEIWVRLFEANRPFFATVSGAIAETNDAYDALRKKVGH